MSGAHRLLIAIALAPLLVAAPTRADVDARALRAALGRVARPLISHGRVTALVEHRLQTPARVPGLIALTPHFSLLRTRPDDFDAAASLLDDARLSWSPPRQLLLDRAGQWTRHVEVYESGSGSGQGVAIGIIDTGVDLLHPDLRNADGTTRVAWLLDFSRPPAGLHPELEESYACSPESGFECQILSAADIDALIAASDLDALPRDEIGHGTHVASLAAGNGLSESPARYLGAAPEATLIAVRVTRASVGIDDFDLLLATDFVFERADALAMPAVVNLSLGSDFGPHDGSSSLGRALSEFLGGPGRAIVVAAGNSGALYGGVGGQYPEPFGVHTDVAVPRGQPVRVPLLTPLPANDATVTRATLFVWIGFEPGSDLRVGLDRLDGPWIEPIARGQAQLVEEDGLEITLLNNEHSSESPLSADTDGAVIVLDGEWAAGRVFVIRLEGEGAANLWVQSEGDLGPGGGSVGALFPRATAAQTINIPALHPELIAVGASVNRDRWPTRLGMTARVDGDALAAVVVPGSAAWFSSAGPMSTGTIKPDLVAPGGFVVGAMSLHADPDLSPFSLFSDSSSCGVPSCSVVSDFHAVTTGTSMASPIVAGTVALLLERDPTLDQQTVRQLLQAGARPLEQSVAPEAAARAGAGLLDAVAALDALTQRTDPQAREPDREASRMILAADFLRPSAESKLQGLVQLRDEQGLPVGGVARNRLELRTQRARVDISLRESAPGLYEFGLEGVPDSAGGDASVTLLLDDEPFLSRRFAVAVDSSAANEGYQTSNGCALGQRRPNAFSLASGLLLALVLGLRRRRGT